MSLCHRRALRTLITAYVFFFVFDAFAFTHLICVFNRFILIHILFHRLAIVAYTQFFCYHFKVVLGVVCFFFLSFSYYYLHGKCCMFLFCTLEVYFNFMLVSFVRARARQWAIYSALNEEPIQCTLWFLCITTNWCECDSPNKCQ